MKYRIFPSLDEASNAELAISQSMHFQGATLHWADITPLTGGRFAVASPDDIGEELVPADFPIDEV
jgi:hypothetical protein